MNVNIDYSRTINQNWKNSDDKNWWSKRSRLEKYLLLSLLLLVATTIGYFVYISMYSKAEPKICITQECLMASSEIISFIDPSVDPCEDFLRFACGRFIDNMHGDIDAASQLSIEALMERQFREIIEEPVDEDDHYLIRNQKELFQACMNESGVEDKSLDIFKQMLEEIDGWPVIVGHRWLARRFDWKDLIYELRNRGYEYNMLLNVDVFTDPVESRRQKIIKINEPILLNVEDRELYKKYMIEVAVAFGAEKILAKNEMEDVLIFMEKLKRVIHNNLDLTPEELTVEEFQDNHNEIDWLDFINTILFPVEGISGEDSVLFPPSKYVEDFFFLLHRTPKRVQANYIIWNVIEDIMPYLPQEIKQIKTNYMCSLKHKPTPSTDRYDECKNLIETRFFPKPLDIIYARKYLSIEKKIGVEAIYEDIKAELKTSLDQVSWLDEESKANSLEKVDAMKISIGFQDDYFNDTIFEKFPIYNEDLNNNDYEEDSSELLNAYLKASKQTVNTLYSLIYFNESLYDILDNGISFYEAINTLILKAPALQGIFYDTKRPAFMNYGTLGSKIGENIMHGVDLYGSNFDSDGNMGEQWTNETRSAYEVQSECFGSNVDYLEDPKGRNIRQVAGAKMSYAAYQNWILRNEEEPQLPGIDYTPNQLFWVSTILPKCYSLVGVDLESDIFADTSPMRHNWNFAQDFDCPADSKMNPSEKCEMY